MAPVSDASSLRGLENGERGAGTTAVKKVTAGGGDTLVVAGAEAEEIAEFIVAPLKALG